MSRKAVLKRIRITPTGKMLNRHARQNHFNAKSSRRTQLAHQGLHSIYPATAKKLKRYL